MSIVIFIFVIISVDSLIDIHDVRTWNLSAAFLDSFEAHTTGLPLTGILKDNVLAYEQVNKWKGGRLWDANRLKRSFQVLNYGQLSLISRKVVAGLPLTIVVFGDSITERFGGCYPLNTAHANPTSLLFKAASLDMPSHMDNPCWIPPLAWLTSFLTLLNHTWPSRQPHRLINLGISAANLGAHAEQGCLEGFVPDQIDLVIIEHLPIIERSTNSRRNGWPLIEYAETHLHRLFLHTVSPLPAVIYLNMFGFEFGNNPTSPMDVAADKCIRNSARCAKDCDPGNFFKDQPKVSEATNKAENDTDLVANHYGFASWSHLSLLEGLIRDRVYKERNMSSCELFALLYSDSFHPRELGLLLMTDVLFFYVANGIEHYKKNLPIDPGIKNVGKPIKQNATVVPFINCYLARASKAGQKEDRLIRAMEVISHDIGWSFVEMDGPEGKKKCKPGWISSMAGSRIRIKVPTPKGSKDHTIDIKLSYLTSYSMMGRAEVTCVDGCTCESKVLDALSATISWSMPELYAFTATLDDGDLQCALEVQVAGTEGRSSHKFKILSITVGSRLNMSSMLTKLGQINKRHP